MGDINYLGSIPLGKMQKWSDKKASSITPISFPGKDAGKTEGIDTLGVIAYFNFSGRWTGKFSVIQGYISSIKSVADGQQTSSQKIKSPFVNSRDSSDNIRFGTIGSNTSSASNKLIDSGANFTGQGVQVGDIVKNLITGNTANVTAIDSSTQLSLDSNIFGSGSLPYAVTATINCKVLSIDIDWELPGLSYCDYKISIMQVA